MTSLDDAARVRQVWPLLLVRDVARSMEYYEARLGFDVVGTAAEARGEVYWCRLERGGACIMLERAARGQLQGERRSSDVRLYFVCDDAEAMYQELSDRGLDASRPEVTDYGMNQLFVVDPDGHELCFESPTGLWAG